jgi:1-deoxy-D-xylulose-5-phosphate reductoisomerase
MPAVLNAANEVAVHYFLNGRLKFTGIAGVVEAVMSRHQRQNIHSIDDVMNADIFARELAAATIKKGGW